MKNKLIPTENVKKAENVLNRLHTKDSSGLVLIYGETGNGKTHYGFKKTFSSEWNYYRFRKVETPKSFLQQVIKRLLKAYEGIESIPKGSAPTLEEMCIDLFIKMPKLTFVFDELNLVLDSKNFAIIEILRDFKDIADATIVMLGEESTREQLKTYNNHFYNRCEFVRFNRCSSADTIQIIKECSEVKFTRDVYEDIVQESKGNIREATKMIKEFELKAREKGLNQISLKDIDNVSTQEN